MTARHFRILLSLVAVALLAALPLSVYAGKGGGKGSGTTTPLTVHVYDQVVDEQDTNTFYGDTSGRYCAGTPAQIFTEGSAVTGDGILAGPSSAYGIGFWPAFPDLSTSYVDNVDCGFNCQDVQFDANNKILTLDTRGTSPSHTLSLNFTKPCDLPGCPGPAGDPTVFNNGTLTEPMLWNISKTSPYASMGICSSVACPEAEPAFGKLWFADPSDASVTWRIDWANLRVLRISANTWYIIADGCDGTQLAGLSKLIGNRTRPKTVFNGYYLIPFFVAAVSQ